MKLKSHNLNVGASIQHFDVDGSLIKEYYYPTSNDGEQVYLEAKVENENGEIIHSEKYPFRSFNHNMLRYQQFILQEWSTGIGAALGFHNLSGSLISWGGLPGYYTEACRFDSAYGQTNVGLCVGTSSATNSMYTDNLHGKIEHGNGTNQLGYQVQTTFPLSIISGSYYLTTTRSFINSGSTSVNIREIGFIGCEATQMNKPNYAFLFCRDTKDYAGNDINIVLPTSSILTVNLNLIYPNNNHLVKSYAQVMECVITNTAASIRPMTSGTLVTVNAQSRNGGIGLFYANTFAECMATGSSIMVGSSSQAFNIDDYKLYGLIKAGYETTSLYYFPNNWYVVSGSDSGSRQLSRMITNYTPNTFTIEEMGLVNWVGTGGTSVANRWLWARTLTGTITLLPSQSLLASYNFNVVVSGS